MAQKILDEADFSRIHLYENYSLEEWNTFHLDVKARYFLDISRKLIREDINRLPDLPLLAIGRGSNLLFLNDFSGTVIHISYDLIQIEEETDDYVLVRVGAGKIFDEFVQYAISQGWAGIENLSYIPGEVGACAVQNIGAYGVEAKDVIESVVCFDMQELRYVTIQQSECRYGYRDSAFKNEWKGRYLVVEVVFRLSKHPDLKLDYGNVRQSLEGIEHPTIADVRRAIINIRRSKLPEVDELGSAGSFFKNPVVSETKFEQLREQYPDIPHFASPDGVKIPAAWLITQAGFKGKTYGGAQVYEKQPLVIVNANNATAADILHLAQDIQSGIERQFGISIEPEVNYIS